MNTLNFLQTNLISSPLILRPFKPHFASCTMRVLSIQSHVVSGYVGSKAAVFPLQTLGIEVDSVHSCHLSNHTGYSGGAPGARLNGDDLREILDGLSRNGLLEKTTHLLTGFIGTASFLHAVADAVIALRNRDSGMPLEYVCDPVLGDNGKLYVPEDLLGIYRSRVVPLATVLTPNLFELGLLAEIPTPSDEATVFKACTKLHASVPLIVVTGAQFAARPHTVSILCSASDGTKFALDAELLHGRFTGSGDLTAALVLAWRDVFGKDDLRTALRHVMATVSAVLQRTLSDKQAANPNVPVPELRLIQSRDDIIKPPLEHVRIREISGSL